MKILVFDVTLTGIAVAVWEDGNVLHHRCSLEDKAQAQQLVPLIQEVLRGARLSFEDLRGVGVTTGPGSFTGVRIGLSTAQGLGLALNVPVVGISTFDALAHSVPSHQRQGTIAVSIDSRRQDSFVQYYDAKLQPQGQPFIAPPGVDIQKFSMTPVILLGNGSRMISQGWPEDTFIFLGIETPDVKAMGELAAQYVKTPHKHPPQPIYLREAEVTQPKRAERAAS